MKQPTHFEEWKAIPGWEGAYEASSDGRIRSLPRVVLRKDGKPLKVKGCILTAGVNDRGYQRVSLPSGGKAKRFGVHQLVAMAFLTPPCGKIGSRKGEFTVNHIDGNKLNNSASNLEYVTCSENVHHARRTGLLDVKGTANNKSVLADADVVEIREKYRLGARQVDLALEYGVCQTTISRVVLRKGWKHIA